MSDAPEHPQLRRALGPGVAISMVVGNVIGAGIFMKPSDAAAATGSFPVIMAAWIAGGFVCVLGALCFAELGVMYPKAGGLYVFLKEAFGRPVAFLFGWSEFVFGRPASIGALAAGMTYQFGQILNTSFGPIEEIIISLGLVACTAAINIRGVVWGGAAQVGTTLVKAGFLFLLALLPFAMFSTGRGINVSNYSTTITPTVDGFSTQFAVALLAIMWAYNGWHAVTPVAEEIKDPQRNVPFAMFGGLAVLIGLYLFANVAYHGVLTMEEVRQAGLGLPQRMVERILGHESSGQGGSSYWVQFGITCVSFAAICSMLGAMNANFMNGPRVSFAMGRDRVFFAQLGHIHPKFRTPHVSIYVQTGMAAVLILASAVLVRVSPIFAKSSIFDILTDYVVVIASIFYMLVVLAVMILRRTQPERERPYKIPLYPYVPIVYLILNGWLIYYLMLNDKHRVEAAWGVGLSLAGLPVYYALFHRLPRAE